MAVAGVIDTIDINDKTDPPQIRIDYTIPLQYLNHAPESNGDEIQIQLQNVSGNAFTLESKLDEQQTVSAEPGSRIPLLDARYEPTGPGRGILIVRFSRRVRFSVNPGADRRHLVINLLSGKATSAPTGPAVEAPPPREAEPPPMPESATPRVPPKAATPPASADMLKNHYVVNLESSVEPPELPALTGLENRDKYVVYIAKFPIDGRVWNRLRVGFFRTRGEARQVLKAVQDQYPRAWISIATEREILSALDQLPTTAPRSGPRVAQPPPEEIKPTRPKTTDEKLKALMEEARQAVARQDYNRAVQLYTKILQYPDHPYRQDALEFLGVARERKGQVAHAIKEYQRYLSLYPDGEGSERVKQRLAGLTTAAEKPRAGIARPQAAKEAKPWDVYGGFSQFYRRDENTIDGADSTVTQSSIASDLDITARRRGDSYDIQSRFTGSYLHDFLNDGPGNESSVSSAYLDANGKELGLSMRLGRQSRNTGGVLGRFDGLLLGYRLTDWLTVNTVGGYPVASTRDSLDTDKYLYGLSADLGTFANAWDFNTFIIEQKVHGVVDRRAIGGEARYFDPIRSLLTFVDYDIFYDSLNTFIFLGTWTLPDRTTINATFDYRNSPILTTTNALQGQTAESINDLLDSFSKDEIRDLAKDRTGENTTATLGASHPFSERFQLSGDITVSNLSDTKASGGVEAIPGTGNEYFYNLQLIGNGLMKSGDISILGLRYSDTSTAKISSLSLNSRYPVNRDWRVNPRVRVDYRDNDRDGSSQWIASPSIRTDYRWRRRYRLEFEGGGEWSTRDLADDTEKSTSYFISVGYRADF
jgi:tetratricopeptide (TPR) repeat protein